MKKLFFAALVATVAVGGAFASNSSTKLLIQGSPFNANTPCIQETVDCVEIGDDVCTILQGTEEVPLFKLGTIAGKCTKPLYKQ